MDSTAFQLNCSNKCMYQGSWTGVALGNYASIISSIIGNRLAYIGAYAVISGQLIFNRYKSQAGKVHHQPFFSCQLHGFRILDSANLHAKLDFVGGFSFSSTEHWGQSHVGWVNSIIAPLVSISGIAEYTAHVYTRNSQATSIMLSIIGAVYQQCWHRQRVSVSHQCLT